MPECFAVVETDHASKYLVQLCKHFAHKVEVDYDDSRARVEFPPGRCLMTAENGRLSFYCRSAKDKGIGVMQYILDDHLARFAWREKPVIDWQPDFPDSTPDDVRSGFDEE